MANAVASSIFACRNGLKAVQSHNPLRGGVAVANGARVAGAVSHSEVMKAAGKAAGKVINPLLVLSCGYNVYKSNDKVKSAAQEGMGLTGMFLLENQMKKGKLGQYVSKGAKWIMEKCSKNAKTQNIGAKIICGLAFVAASIGGYELASKAGGKAIDFIRRSNPDTVNKTYDKAANESLNTNA